MEWNSMWGWVIALSVLMFVASLAALPWVMIWLPADFLTRDGPRLAHWKGRHDLARWCVLIAKNVLGGLVLLLGVIMIFTPGQGLLALLVGLTLIDFPGKRTLLRRIVGRPGIIRTLNRWRAKAGREEIKVPKR